MDQLAAAPDNAPSPFHTPGVFEALRAHTETLNSEHARMLECLRSVLVLVRGNPGEITDLAHEYGIEIPRAQSVLAYQVATAVRTEIETLIAEVECGIDPARDFRTGTFAGETGAAA